MIAKHSIPAALCAGILVSGAGTARALELKDIIIQFDTIHQTVTTFRHEPGRFPVVVDAIAGKLVWAGGVQYCRSKGHSLVYQPGTLTGTADCPVERRGTATDWSESGGTATYTTSMAVAGNIVTLQGKMTGSGKSASNNCGSRSTQEHLAEVTQTLKIRITGKTCQVLQFSNVVVHTDRDTYRADGGALTTEVATHTLRLAPNAKCTILRRSELPIPAPGGLVGVKGNC